ncbi:hypothetical protein [Parazoarcus communis]|uniref:VCBS repeat-containing protein n=1 Tax=Parazoarcus communis SWub3 = DSM 12120 TaxID=1121029 RepID=A0A323UWF2_9RHOO|nr:hypothetical protein [Parazoarcus communis]NMG69005.1 hypothetical protein [Parazoarcus communis SWub3 = DSM 12120]PZA16869.1 hypothetical protein DNK49_09465 [Azoarcus communis] [Parazoarcus communis SWub3 = DSM 12120]
MKIVSSAIEMQSTHVSMQQFDMRERLDMWRSGNQQAPVPTQQVRLSTEGLAAQQAEATQGIDAAEDTDPRLSVLIRMIEFLTGRPVKVMKLGDLQNPSPTEQPQGVGSGGTNTPQAGFGIEYDFEARYSEFEQVSFAASGIVRTADGAEIRFDLGFSMQRRYSESVSMQFRAGDVRVKDPLVLDFGGPNAALSDARFEFDLDGDGNKERIPFAGGSGFLAFDRNHNGRIDDGRELFGPTSGNGFAELSRLDSDGNNWIDENDAAFTQLRIWQPAADGGGTLKTLAEAGVGALYLGRVDTAFSLRNAANETLGLMRASSIYLREDGSTGTVSQIDLSV